MHFYTRNEVIRLWRSITTCTALILLPQSLLDTYTDTVPDVPGEVVLQPYNRNTMHLHILS